MRKPLPSPTESPHSWVQTERAAHEAWARLTVQNPKAGALLHVLAGRVGEHNAVVASQATLASLMGCSLPTVKRALDVLRAGNWLEVRQFGASGSVNAYVLNDRVVWATARDGRRYSLFSAAVVMSADEQPDQDQLGHQEPLRRLPRTGEQQLPTGPGLPPPTQPFLDGFEPGLPATGEISAEERAARGQELAGLAAALKKPPQRLS